MTTHASTAHSFELHAGALRLALRPDLGGCIAGFWHRDTPILRGAEPAALTSSRPVGQLPAGAVLQPPGLPALPLEGPRPHARSRTSTTTRIRCTAWAGSGPGRSSPSSALEVVLRYRHRPTRDWPFAFEATPVLHADAAVDAHRDGGHQPGRHRAAGRPGLAPVLPQARAQPAAHRAVGPLGQRRRAAAGAQGGAARHRQRRRRTWTSTTASRAGAAPARIRDERFSLQLTSSLDRLVVYTPQDKDFFCVEPVSHVSNAIHMADPLAHGLRSVAPGESTSAWMQLDVAVV